VLLFSGTLIHALYYAPDSTATDSAIAVPSVANVATAVLAGTSYPARLGIPSLNVNAAIQYVGVNTKGNMANPTNFTDVGWYKYGTVPGYTGSAVIDGHVDNGLALAGVFKHLSDLKVGDDISILTKSGETIHFVATDLTWYGYKSVPTDLLFNERDDRYLKLITCNGKWVKGDQTYDQRLVVTAVRI
jgi:LPXTG-site transpeptidase (sortase) family protein